MSTVNATLSASPDTESKAFDPWRRGLECLLTAVIDSARPAAALTFSPPTVDLFARALRVVDDRAHDPSFTVAILFDDLHVSSTSLRRAFRHAGTTPGAHIRKTRVHLAVERLQGQPVTEAVLRRIAFSVGFHTARSLRRALHADDVGQFLVHRRQGVGS